MQDHHSDSNQENSFSPRIIFNFLLESWISIFTAGIVGIIVACIYIYVTPNQYVATAKIELIQLQLGGGDNLFKLVDLEDSKLLLNRLRFGDSYSNVEFEACGQIDSEAPVETLGKAVKYSVSKGAGHIIQLKVKLSSKEGAVKCVQALFEHIRNHQARLLKSRIEMASSHLDHLNNYFKQVQDTSLQINRAIDYIYFHEHARFLAGDSMRLKIFINDNSVRQTKLVGGIDASDFPISPRKFLSLLFGLFGGIFLGLFFIFIKHAYSIGRFR